MGPVAPGDDVLLAVEAHLVTALGEPGSRGSVTFLGTDRVDVLRFGPEPDERGAVFRYVTVGLARSPMRDPAAPAPDPHAGPRAELVLTLRGQYDDVLRPLATLAAAPAVEGVVLTAGASVELGAPLWPGAPFSAVLLGEPSGLIRDLDLHERGDSRDHRHRGDSGDRGDPGDRGPLVDGREPVRFLPVHPMTAGEAAYRRVHGAAALQERWLRHGTDLRDPRRGAVPLG